MPATGPTGAVGAVDSAGVFHRYSAHHPYRPSLARHQVDAAVCRRNHTDRRCQTGLDENADHPTRLTTMMPVFPVVPDPAPLEAVAVPDVCSGTAKLTLLNCKP